MKMKTAKEIMVDSPKYCGKQESLQSVVNQMSANNIGSLPVLDENKRVVGIITNQDVCVALGKENKPINEIKVHEVMTPHVHTCKQDDNADTILKIMRDNRVSRLPVTDGEQKLKGILSLNGIVRKIYESSEKGEMDFLDKENIFETLHSIAERNGEYAREYFGE